jgi:hypothetical protein
MEPSHIAVIEALFGSDLYRQSLRLREAVLRAPLGLTITEEELAASRMRKAGRTRRASCSWCSMPAWAAEGFYARFNYLAQGEPFDENTIPHIRMSKRLG